MQSLIRVGRRSELGSTYIGRPTPLGNPFELKQESDRDIICDMYDAWFKKQVELGNKALLAELYKLAELHKAQGYLILGCYCAPKRCHGETIKRFLDSTATKQDNLLLDY